MEYKLSRNFEDLTVDESLEIDAGAYAATSAAHAACMIVCYGIMFPFLKFF